VRPAEAATSVRLFSQGAVEPARPHWREVPWPADRVEALGRETGAAAATPQTEPRRQRRKPSRGGNAAN
jgi:hypothetical protein